MGRDGKGLGCFSWLPGEERKAGLNLCSGQGQGPEGGSGVAEGDLAAG